MPVNRKKIFEDVFHKKITIEEALRMLEGSRPDITDYTRSYYGDSDYVSGHRVYGKPIVLGVTYCGVAIDAILMNRPEKQSIHISKFMFHTPLIMEKNENIVVRIKETEKPGDYEIHAVSEKVDVNKKVASFQIADGCENRKEKFRISDFISAAEQEIGRSDIYAKMKSVRVEFQECLQTVTKVWTKGEEAVCQLVNKLPAEQYNGISPVYLDGAVVGSLCAYSQKENKPFVPLFIQDLYFFPGQKEVCYSRSAVRKMNDDIVVLDINLLDEDGNTVLKMERLTIKKAENMEVLSAGKREIEQSAEQMRRKPVKEAHSLKDQLIGYLMEKVNAFSKNLNFEIETDKNFLDLGLESDQLVRLVAVLEQDFGIELYPTLFFEYQNIEEVTEFLMKQFHEQTEAFLGKETPDFPEDPDGKESGEELFEDALAEPAVPNREENDREEMNPEENAGDIAVIGMQGIFADSDNLEEFWENLIQGKDLIKEIPADHFDYEPWFSDDMNEPDKMYCKWGSFIDHVGDFDADFFRISPREADVMDPQLRLLMQILYRTAEDAGKIKTLKGTRTGMFVGACFQDYSSEMGKSGKKVGPYDGSGNAQTMYANRPSFFFDLKGPSIAVDTACSSSLVAVHLACNALRSGECEMAFAAGINLLLSAWHYRYFSSIQALSPTGRCHSFDEKADGYVPGEGIAAVLLKPLDKARKDGDHIYCVIKGSAVNHGGYTPSITAPSKKMEEEVLVQAWKNAGINPADLGYIEAHGTGTKLGDPIEINALKDAFERFTDRKAFCAVGSAKAHIGHTEGAAGITGLIKAALMLKKKMIPAMPGFEKCNPFIRLEDSPLFINEKTVEWKAAERKKRCAGVSSFGFGGTYAHVVLEEYDQQEIRQEENKKTVIILSAKTEASLKKQAIVLKNALDDNMSISQIAFVEAFGRMEFEERVAFVADSIGDLRKQLTDYSERGIAVFSSADGGYAKGSDIDIDRAYQTKDLDGIAEYWTSGREVDWTRVIGREQILSLPGYQFIGRKYWFPEPAREEESGKIHYLLDANISDLSGITYVKKFTLKEPYVRDHVIKNRHVLPGVVTLEMAHIAGWFAGGKKGGMEIHDFVWKNPLVTDAEGIRVYTAFVQQADGYSVTVYSENDENKIVYAEGKLRYCAENVEEEKTIMYEKPEGLRIDESLCYEMLAQSGLVIGEALKAVKEIHVNGNIAYVEMENEYGADRQFPVNPGMLDGAIQSMIAFSYGTGMELHIPYKMGKIRYFRPISGKAFAILKLAEDAEKSDGEKTADISIYDENKCLAVRMSGLKLRRAVFAEKVHLYHKAWAEIEDWKAEAGNGAETFFHADRPSDQLAGKVRKCAGNVFGRLTELSTEAIEKIGEQSEVRIVYVDSNSGEMTPEEQGQSISKAFRYVLDALKTLLRKKAKISFIYCFGAESNEGMEAFLASAAKEETLSYLIAEECINTPPEILEEMMRKRLPDEAIRYNGKYLHKVLEKIEVGQSETLFSDGMVCVISGGTGRIGMQLGQYLLNRYRAKVVLLGRKTPATQLNGLMFRECDITDLSAVRSVLREIRKQYGDVNGIIHLAGVKNDSLLRNMEYESAKKTVDTKVMGAVNLDLASREDRLDFFICFSSIASCYGNEGQADYAFANGCLNSFAKKRNSLAGQKLVCGRTLSICYPLWEQGGMTADTEKVKRLKEKYGMEPIASGEGIRILERIPVNEDVFIPISGKMDTHGMKHQSQKEKSDTEIQDYNWFEKEVKELFAVILGRNASEIDSNRRMADYGLESVSITEFVYKISQKFGIELKPSVFYELNTLKNLTDYMIKNYDLRCAAKAEADEEKAETNEENTAENVFAERPFSGSPVRADERREPVAIVGMAGVMPGCDNLDEFWDALVKEQDLISIVPGDRWDWQEYYGDARKQVGKTECNKGGFINGVREFDAEYFALSDREAESMDPQQRIFMRTVWECIENAGYHVKDLSGTNTGLFVGVGNFDYSDIMHENHIPVDAFAATGVAHSMLANRISYMLNLKGVSEPIDTACSSSLVAVLHALMYIQNGYCDMAIAGGVNLILSPNMTLAFSNAGMLSNDGACKTFDDSANGYVRGEGAGAILLKPLSKALEAGDYIHALILGGSVNHGGKTNTLTAPSPEGQARVIEDAYRRAGVSSDTITYIEAHGTGTSLGDPIEIDGLCKAFHIDVIHGEKVEDKYCGIGSVKSNIGHLETAAGIAGILKTVLALEHKTIPASLHYHNRNRYIDFEKTPFFVAEHTQYWRQLVDAEKNPVARRAGVSSFGFGGVNAHIVLEEFDNDSRFRNDHCGYSKNMIVFSAKTRAQTKEYAEKILDFIQKNEKESLCGSISEQDFLNHMAYTLQMSRSMEKERVAVAAESIGQLQNSLQNYITGQEDASVFTGDIEGRRTLFSEEEVETILDPLYKNREFERIAKFWLEGIPVKWSKLYKDKMIRLPLPTYPFEKEEHWIAQISRQQKKVVLTPVIDREISAPGEICFEKVFSKEDFYMRDHVIDGRSVLPGVVYLEMIKQAVNLSAERHEQILMEQIVWKNPIILSNGEYAANISLEKRADHCLGRVYRQGDQKDIHFSCRINSEGLPEQKRLDIAGIGKTLTQDLSREAFYADFAEKGLELGAGLNAIQGLKRSDREVLACYRVAPELREEFEKYDLHPCILDAAITSPKGIKQADAGRLFIPFSIDSVNVWGKIPAEGYIYTRVAGADVSAAEIRKYNISIVDDRGYVMVEMNGLLPRELKQNSSLLKMETSLRRKDMSDVSETKDPIAVVCRDLSEKDEMRRFFREAGCKRELKFLGGEEISELMKIPGPVNVIFMMPQEHILDALYRLHRVLSQISKEKGEVHLLIADVSGDEDAGGLCGVDGWVQSVNKECPKIHMTVIHMKELCPAELLCEAVSVASQDAILYYRDGELWKREYKAADFRKDGDRAIRIERGQYYLVTGGLGKIGYAVAHHIAGLGGNLILLGRNVPDADRRTKLDALREEGVNARYYCCDLTDQARIIEVADELKKNGIALRGILHLAGISRDALLTNKTIEQVTQVVKTKSDSAGFLDQVFEKEKLDFFVVFSSISGVVGNAGQADYAYANAELFRFARNRNRMTDMHARYGKAISVAWSLWEDGGIVISEGRKEYLEEAVGMIPIAMAEGIRTLFDISAEDGEEAVLIKGNPEKLSRLFAPVEEKTVKKDNGASDCRGFYDELEQIIKRIIKRKKAIDPKTDLSQYGFDSFTYSELAEILNQKYGLDLSPALFFEYPTMKSMYEYLTDKYSGFLTEKQNFGDAASDSETTAGGQGDEQCVHYVEEPEGEAEDMVAVIGLSCRFPASDNADAFYEHLLHGDDLVCEIPEDRWDWRAYYGDPREEGNKTTAKWGGFMNDVRSFDSKLFHISPKEAALMDPQHRLFIQTVWNAIEEAGYRADELRGSNTAIYVGISGWDYNEVLRQASDQVEALSVIGIAHSVLPNRISYMMDWHGPSEPIDTACSSSLVAVHKAVEQIRTGKSEYAVAGGVNLMLTPTVHISFGKAGMLSPEGKCRAFDKDADGYVRGEGVGAILLKSYKKALADGDHIHALIKGTAVNHGGQVNSFTAPNPNAQAEVIQAAWKDAGVTPDTISYIEAHGTGTRLGDPIEIQALNKAFHMEQKTNLQRRTCGIGSVKSNIGHLEAAAGIASMIKVILSLENEMIPPTIHFQELNPHIRLEESPFYICHGDAMPWKRLTDKYGGEIPRRAGVSSFGFGGVNAHIILEEAEVCRAAIVSDTTVPIVLSARTETQVREYAGLLYRFLSEKTDARVSRRQINMQDLAYTLMYGRTRYSARAGFYAQNMEQVRETLRKLMCGEKISEVLYMTQNDDEKEEVFFESGDLLSAWLYDVNFYEKEKRIPEGRRISLPGYPFAKTEFWGGVSQVKNSLSLKDAYTPIWQECGFETEMPAGRSAAVIADDLQNPMAVRIHDYLTGRNIVSEILRADMLIENASALYGKEHIYFVGATYHEQIDFQTKRVEDEKKNGIHALHTLLQLLANKERGTGSTEITLVTENLCTVLGEEIINPYQGSLYGLLSSAVKEFAFLKGTAIDLAKCGGSEENEADLEYIVGLKCDKKCGQFAVRSRKLFECRLTKTVLNKQQSVFRNNGVYVIIGGMGGIGTALGEYLAERYHAVIISVGRSDPAMEKLERTRQTIERKGGRFSYRKADSGDVVQMMCVVNEVETEFGKINGVIHSAIVLRDRNVLDMSREDLDVPLWPKMNGCIGLYEAFKGRQPDFMLLLSSVQSSLGMKGQGNYASGCTFEDAFGRYVKQVTDWNVHVINWGYWGSTGIVAGNGYREFMKSQGIHSIEPQEGFAYIEAILSNPFPQVYVIKGEESVLKGIGFYNDQRRVCAEPARIPDTFRINSPVTVREVIGENTGYEYLEEYSCQQLAGIFQKKGIFLAADEVIAVQEIKDMLCIIPKYGRLFDEMLRILEKAGYIEQIGAEVRTTEKILFAAQQKYLNGRELSEKYPELKHYIILTDACIKYYNEMLCGNIEATNVMFPEGNMDLVGNIYKGNALSDYYNEKVGEIVSQCVAGAVKEGSMEKIRILEIGAGTGGTSAGVLKKLEAFGDHICYTYTDISESFLKYGEHAYGQKYPFMEFKILDVSRESAEDIGKYDIVFASNVLHATSNLKRTIHTVKQKMKKGALLVINEMVKKEAYVTMTFGLLDGWWYYEDEENRITGSPLMSAELWEKVLRNEGFMKFTRVNRGECSELPQDVLTGISDGIIAFAADEEKNSPPDSIETTVQKNRKPVDAGAAESFLPIRQKDDICAQVKKCLRKVLGIGEDDFDEETPFVDLGIDSILSMEFMDLINSSMGLQLRPTELYSSSNLRLLCDRIAEEKGIPDDSGDRETVFSPKEEAKDAEAMDDEEMLSFLSDLYEGKATFNE